jgi:regulatory protein
MTQRLSLKGRALQWLAQREHSYLELKRKLLKAERAASADDPNDDQPERIACQVEAILVWLQARHYLSDERFAQSRIHTRSPKFGTLRIRQELAQHGVQMSLSDQQKLQDTELERATHIWQKKFGTAPPDSKEYAKQMRFLLSRGFGNDVVHQLLRHNHVLAVR